jgi:hypothetical protein
MHNRSYIEELIRKYQIKFALQDWKILLRLPTNDNQTRFADTDVDQISKLAIINVYKNRKFTDGVTVEEVIRHEFAHILNADLRALWSYLHKNNVLNDAYYEMFEMWNERYASHFERFNLEDTKKSPPL